MNGSTRTIACFWSFVFSVGVASARPAVDLLGWNRSVTWNGLDNVGRRAPTGVYLYRLDAAGTPQTRKMVSMK